MEGENRGEETKHMLKKVEKKKDDKIIEDETGEKEMFYQKFELDPARLFIKAENKPRRQQTAGECIAWLVSWPTVKEDDSHEQQRKLI